MSRDLEVEQLAASVADEEEDVEGLEGQGLDDEEVRPGGGRLAKARTAGTYEAKMR